MSPVRILIAEDERAQREHLIALIDALWPEAELVAACGDGDSALAALERDKPQVLFLDIRMPGASGIDVARSASGRAHVVLTTAYEQYAIQAFEAGALDYLLKPVTADRLAATIQRLRARLNAAPPDIGALLASLDERLGQPAVERLKWITATQGDTVRLLAVEDVLFFRASDKYVRVVTAEEEALVRMSLKELEDRLDPEHFWRIHRSVLVAAPAVSHIEKDELGRWHARLRGHAEALPVSDSARSRFRGM
ncbi:LytR/AlgR family response regulator transcription factor [Wenzhouxiangella marina]|uniref:Two component transcriptional regulator, LytTR family n=1 Tax=Wenzhouxiangella marina TaxID=1579979 RepID=A0A0K0XRY6_9GAMM|nr:LytTR family DNA-binding domain-containing protein [Wenzhouxiangella marina]AKS40474.1 Two component transcriptional regulator, LytTR family [Wenzhouxiangella marina]MBB6088204.1 DNA-binding LytR/AlgR family response regulator [Wenzhouxiangella marina]